VTKFYIDETGARFRIDRETGEKVLIPETESEAGEAGAPQSIGEPTVNED